MQELRELKRYVEQTLGISVDTGSWGDESRLPFFLRDTYDFFLLNMQGRQFLLMVDVQQEETSPSTIRKHMEQLRNVCMDDVIYVREQVTSYNRNRLIKNKIPFIVPGNQLYLPMMALDLREYFVTKRGAAKNLSPAAQVLVLYSIYKHRVLFDESVTMTDWAEELGYTKMTMTRAFRDLRSILEKEDDVEGIRGRQLWDCLRPFLRSPVLRTRYYDFDVFGSESVLAGDSAMAEYTMMAASAARTICMEAEQWKKNHSEETCELPNAELGATIVQVWRYDPRRLDRNGVADPLSVYLSFGKNKDERVEMALENLLEDVQW